MYEITRLFTSGLLSGLTYTETTSVFLPVGFECKKPCGGGSGYKIIAVVPA
jgi:hypothetical protein